MKKIYFKLSATVHDDGKEVEEVGMEVQGTKSELCTLLQIAAVQYEEIEKIIKLVAENFDNVASTTNEIKDISDKN